MRSAEGWSAPKQTRIAGLSADGQMRGKSAQATDSRSRAPAGTANAAAPSVIATRSAPSRAVAPVLPGHPLDDRRGVAALPGQVEALAVVAFRGPGAGHVREHGGVAALAQPDPGALEEAADDVVLAVRVVADQDGNGFRGVR